MVALRFLGTMILSSMKTRPNRLDSFLFCIWYSSGISSCSCRSKLTSIFSSVGSLVVSVNSSCRSVEKFFSVSRTVCSRSQLFSSSAATLGACPNFTYCTLFTPTYRAQFHTGTSRMDGSWSVSDSISPSSMGIWANWCCVSVVADDGPSLSCWLWSCCCCCCCWPGVGRSTSQNGSTVHCSDRLVCGWKPPLCCGPILCLRSHCCRPCIICCNRSSITFLSLLRNFGSWYFFHFPLLSGNYRALLCPSTVELIQWFRVMNLLLQDYHLFGRPL